MVLCIMRSMPGIVDGRKKFVFHNNKMLARDDIYRIMVRVDLVIGMSASAGVIDKIG